MPKITEAEYQAIKQNWINRIEKGEFAKNRLLFIQEFIDCDLPVVLKLAVMSHRFNIKVKVDGGMGGLIKESRHCVYYTLGHLIAMEEYYNKKATIAYLQYLLKLLENKENIDAMPEKILSLLNMRTRDDRSLGETICHADVMGTWIGDVFAHRDFISTKILLVLMDHLLIYRGTHAKILELLETMVRDIDDMIGPEGAKSTCRALLEKLLTSPELIAPAETWRILKAIGELELFLSLVVRKHLNPEAQYKLLSVLELSKDDYQNFNKEEIYQYILTLVKPESGLSKAKQLKILNAAINPDTPLGKFFSHEEDPYSYNSMFDFLIDTYSKKIMKLIVKIKEEELGEGSKLSSSSSSTSSASSSSSIKEKNTLLNNNNAAFSEAELHVKLSPEMKSYLLRFIDENTGKTKAKNTDEIARLGIVTKPGWVDCTEPEPQETAMNNPVKLGDNHFDLDTLINLPEQADGTRLHPRTRKPSSLSEIAPAADIQDAIEQTIATAKLATAEKVTAPTPSAPPLEPIYNPLPSAPPLNVAKVAESINDDGDDIVVIHPPLDPHPNDIELIQLTSADNSTTNKPSPAPWQFYKAEAAAPAVTNSFPAIPKDELEIQPRIAELG